LSRNDERGYNGWTNWDTWAVNLWATNDSDFYHHRLMPMIQAVNKWKAKGRFDRNRAIGGFIRVAKDAARLARKSGDMVNNRVVNWTEIAESWLRDSSEYVK